MNGLTVVKLGGSFTFSSRLQDWIAVIAAYAVTYPWSRVLSFVPLGFIPLIFPLPAFLFAFAWFGMQLLQGSIELTSSTMAASVAWWAHIGGFVFGALVGLIARHAVPPVDTRRR